MPARAKGPQMSVEHLAIVLHHSAAVGTDKVVMLGIANHDGDGGAFPAHSTLAKYANVDISNVRKALRKLVAAGELRIEERFTTSPTGAVVNQSNRYFILVQCPPTCDRSPQHRINAGHKSEQAHTPRGVGADAQGGVGASAQRGGAHTPTKPPTNPPTKTSISRKQLRTVPDTWSPGPKQIEKAITLGLNPQAEAEEFRDGSIAKNRRYADFDRAFSTWLTKAVEFGRARSTQPEREELWT
jgi:Helix-turn-helix domain